MLVCLVTVPSLEEAHRIARALVEERLAACVNILPGLRSVYWWEGAVEEAQEILLLVKTVPEQFNAVRDRVLSLHSYQVPEVVALPVHGAAAAYERWVRQSVSAG